MINDLTAYFRIYQLEYHQYRKITIDLKQEFVKELHTVDIVFFVANLMQIRYVINVCGIILIVQNWQY